MHWEKAEDTGEGGGVRIDPSLFSAIDLERGPLRRRERLSVALVGGEGLQTALGRDTRLTSLTPSDWRAQLKAASPDMLLLTTTGPIARGEWGNRAGAFGLLEELLDACSNRYVPTVLLADEDPRWFFKYLPLAEKADHVITTDVSCLDGYRFELGHNRIHHLSSGVDTVKYTPVGSEGREEAFCYLADRDLTDDEGALLTTLINAAGEFLPVRVHEVRSPEEPPFRLPPAAAELMAGLVSEVDAPRISRRYKYGIVLCRGVQSQSSVDDAVLKFAASNTPVVCNYSRAVRNHFGDLVISSDDPVELARRLREWEASVEAVRKISNLLLRKVRTGYTLAARVASLVAALTGFPRADREEAITLLAFASNQEEADRLQKSLASQTHKNTRLALIGSEDLKVRHPGVTLRPTLLEAQGDLLLADLVAPVSARDYHGPNYLADLALALRHSGCSAAGKDVHYRLGLGGALLLSEGERHGTVEELRAISALISPTRFPFARVATGAELENLRLTGADLYAADEFNYCLGGASSPPVRVAARVDDPAGIDCGLTLEGHPLLRLTGECGQEERDGGEKPVLDGAALYANLPRTLPEGIAFSLLEGELELTSTLDAKDFKYVYSTARYTLDELALTGGGWCQSFASTAFDLGIVLIFLDGAGARLSNALVLGGRLTRIVPPEGAARVGIGFRIKGPGVTSIQRLAFYDTKREQELILPRSRCLILTAHYPSYGDLYKYGFLHARVRAYKESGTLVDVFQETPNLPTRFSEFENIDVTHGDITVLDSILATGVHTHVFVHVLIERYWKVLEKYLDRVKVAVWVHGMEIQPWYRRAFNYETEDERGKARLECDKRLQMWKKVLGNVHPNFKMINVSRYHAMEVANDLDVELGDENQEIIPNYVNEKIFSYHRKTADQSKRILSIRPYSSRVYANDLAVEAVERLSGEPFFNELEFLFIGDGALFDQTVLPLRKFSNVRLEKKFITQYEIAKLHRDYGIFLVPSRGDTQGVSRDEAMSSGLVAVTNRVAAIPDFADESCAMIAEPEDAAGLADAIKKLVEDPLLFLTLSKKGSERVRELTSRKRTIDRELALLEDGAVIDSERPAIMDRVAPAARLALYSHHDQNRPASQAGLAVELARTLSELPGVHASFYLNAVVRDTCLIEPLLHLSRGVRLAEPSPANLARLTADEALALLHREDKAKNFTRLIIGGESVLEKATHSPSLAPRLVPLLDSECVRDGALTPGATAALANLAPYRPGIVVQDPSVAVAVEKVFPELAGSILIMPCEPLELSWLPEKSAARNPGEEDSQKAREL